MKVAIHLTEKVTYRWPIEYWVEVIHKLTKAGHEVYAVSDEYNVVIEDKNPLLFDRLNLSDELSKQVIAKCDVFIGVPLKYYHMAKELGVRTVGLLGSTWKGDGIKSPTQCAPCREHIENVNDCIWDADYLCMHEITPNDVMEVLCV
jgi:ADP-heptose:LPS heptosyltransferase